MKHFIFLIGFLIGTFVAFGQQNNKFYNPQKECFPIESPAYKAVMEVVDEDSIYVLKAYPEGEVKGTVFFYHGNSGNLTNAVSQSFLRLLTGAGYQVFAFDYPGFGHSTGAPTHGNIARNADYLFKQWIEDAEVKGNEIIVYGSSIGAQIAATLAAGNETKINALVLDGCSPSFTALAEQFTPEEYRPYVRKSVISPYSVEQSVQKLQSIEVLYIHSKTDVISYDEAERMYNLTKAPKSFWTYEGKHLEASRLYPVSFIERMNGLLR